MILIDAENESDRLDDMYTLGEIGRRERDDIATFMLEIAMPIDAIPIEWIKQYGEQNWFDYGTQHNAITCMLKAWEERKEDGKH